jgi:hypothetical protein
MDKTKIKLNTYPENWQYIKRKKTLKKSSKPNKKKQNLQKRESKVNNEDKRIKK